MTVWWLAWRSALARRRLFAWNVAVPALLLAPVALSEAAAPHRVAVYGVFLVFFSTFGAAIPTVRDARDGWLDAVFRTGFGRSAWFVQTAVAEAALDLLQLLPVLVLFVLAAPAVSWRSLAAVAAALPVALLFGNVVGLVLAALVRSLAEAALASAAASLFLLHFAGFFRRPAAGWTAMVATLDPYTPLRVALEGLAAGAAPAGRAAPGASAMALALTALAALAADRWTRRFEWPTGE